MKAFHLFLCICSAHIHAFLSYQTSLTKHKIQDKNKNTKMVIAECKTEKGGQSGGGLVTAGVTCPQIIQVLIPLGFPVPPTL